MMAMIRIWHMYILLATAATVCLAISSCNGAPLPQSLQKEGSLSRGKRGIFGQLTSVTTTTTVTATPRFKFGTTTKLRHAAHKKTSTTSTTTTTARPELNDAFTSSQENIALHEKQIMEHTEKITPSTLSTSSLSPVYVNSSPSALMLHMTESSEAAIVFPNDEPANPERHFPSKEENIPKKEKHEETANNRALSSSSIWNLIVVLLQLAYTVIQQKIPP